MLKPLLKIVGSLGIAGAFLWAAFQNVDWTLLRQTLKSASYTWLILSAIVIIFSCLPRAWRWQILLAPISKDITIRATFRAVLVAYAGNILTMFGFPEKPAAEGIDVTEDGTITGLF